jgi:hypothetical protein
MGRFLITLGIFLCAIVSANSQILSPSTINSASGSGSISGQFIEWNLGDIIITTSTAGGIIVTQGFLQNQPGFPTSVTNTQNFSAFEIKFLPNPTHNILQYNLSILNPGRISMLLYDMNGKLLSSKQLQHMGGNQNGVIDMSALPAASYQLLIRFEPVNGNNKQGVYSIQKIN